jgi:hypothetical protein
VKGACDETQVVLHQAQQILQGVLSQLTGSHPTAVANVNAAIVEINTALSIK